MFRKVMIFFSLVIIFGAGLIFYKNTHDSSLYAQIQYIKSHYSGGGKLRDFQNDLNVKDIKSFKWYETPKEIEIQYGGIKLKMPKDVFLSKGMQEQLNSIFIEYRSSTKDESFGKLYYKGEEIEKWVR